MYQEEFNQLYDRLFKYAMNRAARYFNDFILREDVADKALEEVVVYWTEKCDGYNEDEAKRIICDSVRNWSRKGEELEGMDRRSLKMSEGMSGYRVI